jgi:hypothetical protein
MISCYCRTIEILVPLASALGASVYNSEETDTALVKEGNFLVWSHSIATLNVFLQQFFFGKNIQT